MRKLSALLGAVVFSLATLWSLPASATDFKNGADYLTLPEVQNTDAAGKVEVTEFFAYYCPHCNRFEPLLAAWVKKNADKIVFKRVHIASGGGVEVQQRLYYTLEALGAVPQYHQKVFDAMHVERNRLATEAAVFEWAQKAGLDRARFLDAWNSFGVQAKMRRANAMMGSYRIDSWPTVAVGGHYLTSPSLASEGNSSLQTEEQMQEGALKIMDFLVTKAGAEKK